MDVDKLVDVLAIWIQNGILISLKCTLCWMCSMFGSVIPSHSPYACVEQAFDGAVDFLLCSFGIEYCIICIVDILFVISASKNWWLEFTWVIARSGMQSYILTILYSTLVPYYVLVHGIPFVHMIHFVTNRISPHSIIGRVRFGIEREKMVSKIPNPVNKAMPESG